MKNSLLVLIALTCSLLCTPPAKAAGLGVYGFLGGGSADWTPDFNNSSFDKTTGHVGAGLVLDTAPARDTLFNYQLNLGYDHFTNSNSQAWGNATFNGFAVSNNFGFGAMINPTTRFWFGPELRLTWADGSPDHYKDFKMSLFGLGVGPVIGVKLNYDDKHTIALKAGFQYIHYVGTGDGKFSHTTNSATSNSNSYDYETTEKMVYVAVEFLFRTSSDR